MRHRIASARQLAVALPARLEPAAAFECRRSVKRLHQTRGPKHAFSKSSPPRFRVSGFEDERASIQVMCSQRGLLAIRRRSRAAPMRGLNRHVAV